MPSMSGQGRIARQWWRDHRQSFGTAKFVVLCIFLSVGGCKAQVVPEPRETAACITVTSPIQVLHAVQVAAPEGGDVCLLLPPKEALTFHGSDALVIPSGMSVSLDCQGGRADLASYQGDLTLGQGATLALRNCTISTYLPGAAAEVPANAETPFSLFGNSPNSLVQVEHSYLEAPCTVAHLVAI
eukprot:jgi/Ulvmu1/764/UM010_0138.1